MKSKLLVWLAALVLAFGWPSALLCQTSDPVLVGAGDCCACLSGRLQYAQATAALIDSIPGTVFAAGDLAYLNGTDGDFSRCYAPTWGHLRARTTPAPGNHEYNSHGAFAYFNYFGPAAGQPGKGYYSYDLGAWHVIILNSNCSDAGGCTSTSPQGQWLQADVAAHPALCTVAIWHHPLYSSTTSAITSAVQPLWQMLYAAGAELVLNGHAHDYERFAPQDPNGNLDLSKGIRQFVVGTGGNGLDSFQTTAANSEVRASSYGVLKLTLHSGSYDWQFVPIPGSSSSDSGTTSCH